MIPLSADELPISADELGGWRITEWRKDTHLFLGQMCWLRVRELGRSVIGEIVALEANLCGTDLVRVMLWCRSLRTTLPRRPRDIVPLEPRAQLRLVRSADWNQEEIIA